MQNAAEELMGTDGLGHEGVQIDDSQCFNGFSGVEVLLHEGWFGRTFN